MHGGEMNPSRLWKIEIILSLSLPFLSVTYNVMDREAHTHFIPSQISIDNKGDSKKFLQFSIALVLV